MSVLIAILMSICIFLFSTFANAQSFGAKTCANNNKVFCYTVKRGDTWQKLFKDPKQRDLVMRINRINTHLSSGMRIAIPHNLNADSLSFSPLYQQIKSPGQKVIIVSLSKLAFGAYSADGVLQYWGPVSGGKGYCPDIGRRCNSPSGDFVIYSKGGQHCVSTKFPVGRGGAPMPYCMFFKGGFALHGSYEVPGYNASHGCIRMFVNDARWLNTEFTAGEKVAVEINH